jgi:hypothetical protein
MKKRLIINLPDVMKRSLIVVAISFSLGMAVSSCKKDDDKKEQKTVVDAVTFEDFNLGEEGYYNGSDGLGGFTLGNLIFKNTYNAEWGSWSGFAVSDRSDTITPDFSNQYSSIAGSGAGPSLKYAVLYSYSEDTIVLIKPALITNLAVSNTTYAYYSMKNGNQFSKKFGGESGNDPDWFALHISAVDSTGLRRDFNAIPLADFTYDDHSQDYISNKWEYYNLEAAGYIKYLIFSFSSSDTSSYGINTPTYVCIDNISDEYKE